jgi:hypothetical protein
MLERAGARPKTSRHPGILACELGIEGAPEAAKSAAHLHVTAQALNIGDTLWNAKPSRRGGFVTVGCKLMTADGRLLDDRLGRTFLPRDVAPGDAVRVPVSLSLPADLPPGPYRLVFDLVAEQICWFSDLSPGRAVVKTLVIR